MLSLFILTLMIAFSSFSQEGKIKIAIGDDLPPWILGNGQSGILIDLVKDCLNSTNYELEFIAYPYARRLTAEKKNDVDVVIDINTKVIASETLVGFFTGYLYAYENFAFSLSENNFSVKNIEDLEQYSLLSWQGAINHLGGEYADMAKENPRYAETSRQNNQVRMLFRKRIDFIQLDYQIYLYHKTELIKANEIDSKLDVSSFALFGKSPNGLMFKNKELRDICRSQLEKVEMKNKYKDISP
jgi:polar amino acid transport system substrate-binding protein